MTLLGDYITEEEEQELIERLNNGPRSLWEAFLEGDLAKDEIETRIDAEDHLYQEACLLAEAMLQCEINVCKSQIEKMWPYGHGSFDSDYIHVLKKFEELGGGREHDSWENNRIPHPNVKLMLLNMVLSREDIIKKIERSYSNLHIGHAQTRAETISIDERATSDSRSAHATDNCEQALRDAYAEAIIADRLCKEAVQRKADAFQHLRQIDQISEFNFEIYYDDGSPVSGGIWGSFHTSIEKAANDIKKRTELSANQRDGLKAEISSACWMRILGDHQGTIIRYSQSKIPGEQLGHRGSIAFEDRLHWVPEKFPEDEDYVVHDEQADRILELIEEQLEN